MPGEPFVVGRARHADHGGPGPPGQLDRDRADPACRPRHDQRVALGQRDRPHRRVGREAATTDKGPGHLPRHGGATCRHQVSRLDQDVLGLAGPVVGEADDLVAARRIRSRQGPARSHDPGQVAALAGREHRLPPECSSPSRILAPRRVDPRRLDLDQTRPGAGYRPGNLHPPLRTSTPPYSSNRTASASPLRSPGSSQASA